MPESSARIKPGRIDCGVLVLGRAHSLSAGAPLNFEQALVDTLGRHSRRGAQRLHREAVEASQRPPGASVIVMSLSTSSLVADTTRT